MEGKWLFCRAAWRGKISEAGREGVRLPCDVSSTASMSILVRMRSYGG